MIKKRITKLLAVAVLSMISNTPLCYSQDFKFTVINDAPFKMEAIKEYVFPDRSFNIKDYGAMAGDGSMCTRAIAKAIEECANAGGGHVIIPEGEWLTGAIHLKSGIDLHIEEGAVLRFTDDYLCYLPAVKTSWEGVECYNYSPLIYAYECENVAITGKGTINPKMDFWHTWFDRPESHIEATRLLYTMGATDVDVEKRQMTQKGYDMRPHLIQFNRCKNVLLDGFKVRESPFWTIHMLLCDGGIVRNLDIKAHGHNNDGIDIEMSRQFLVENCVFDQGDDAVVIKSGRNADAWRLNTPTENIVIRNCTIKQGHTLLGIGSELSGGVRNIYMKDSKVEEVRRLFYVKTNHRRGGFVENIHLDGVKTGHVQRLFAIDTDVVYQWKDFPDYETKYTRIEGLYLSNVECDSADGVIEINGDSALPPKGIELKNIKVGKAIDFFKKVTNASDIKEKNVKWAQ